MVSLKIKRKKKYSRRTNKQRRNNTKKKYRRKNDTRKVKRKIKRKILIGGNKNVIYFIFKINGSDRKLAFILMNEDTSNDRFKTVLDNAIKNLPGIVSRLDEATAEIRFQKNNSQSMTKQEYINILQELLMQKNEPHKFIKQIECEGLIPNDIINKIYSFVENNRDGKIQIISCEVQLQCKTRGDKDIDELITQEKHDDEYSVSLKSIDEEGQRHEVEVINKTKSAMFQLEIMNLGDQIHDFIASGYLSYNALLSYKIILRSQAALANLTVKAGEEEVSLNFPQKVRLLEKLATDVILDKEEITKMQAFKNKLKEKDNDEYKKLMDFYGIDSEPESPSLSEYIFYLIFSKGKKGERMMHKSLSVGKNIEHKFIKGVFNLIQHYTVQKPKLYYNPKKSSSGKITAEFASVWEDIESNDTIEPVHINQYGTGVDVWDSFLATGNNVLREYVDFKQLVDYIPKPSQEDLEEKWDFSVKNTFIKAVEIFNNHFIDQEDEKRELIEYSNDDEELAQYYSEYHGFFVYSIFNVKIREFWNEINDTSESLLKRYIEWFNKGDVREKINNIFVKRLTHVTVDAFKSFGNVAPFLKWITRDSDSVDSYVNYTGINTISQDRDMASARLGDAKTDYGDKFIDQHSKPKAIKDSSDKAVEFKDAYQSNLSVIHQYDDDNSFKVEQKYTGGEFVNPKMLDLAGHFLLLNKSFSRIYGDNLVKKKFKIDSIRPLGQDYYEITFYTIIEDRAVKSSYKLTGSKEKLKNKFNELINEVQKDENEDPISFTARQHAQRQNINYLFPDGDWNPQWINGITIYNAIVSLQNFAQSEQGDNIWADPAVDEEIKTIVASNLGLTPENVRYLKTGGFSIFLRMEVEVANFDKFLNETVGTKKTKLFFFINYLLIMEGRGLLNSLSNISENDITLIEQILISEGDKVLDDFFKDSKLVEKSFDLDTPRWKGTKTGERGERVNWFPDFPKTMNKSDQLKQLITSPFYTYSSTNMRSQRLYDPFPINSKTQGQDEIYLIGNPGSNPKKTLVVNKSKKDEILNQIISHNYVPGIETLDNVLNIWDGWVRANYFNNIPPGETMIETLIGLQTSIIKQGTNNKFLLGDVMYILENPIEITSYGGNAEIRSLKLRVNNKYREMYCGAQPSDQESNFWLTKTNVLVQPNDNYKKIYPHEWVVSAPVDQFYLPCIIPSEKWTPQQLKGLYIRYYTYYSAGKTCNRYQDFILRVLAGNHAKPKTIKLDKELFVTNVGSNAKVLSLKCYEYELILKNQKTPLYMYQQIDNAGTIIISRMKYLSPESFWEQGDLLGQNSGQVIGKMFKNIIRYIKYFKGTFNSDGDLKAGSLQEDMLSHALGEADSMHISEQSKTQLKKLLSRNSIKLLYKMWMHDFGLQKGMLVRTAYMLGKKAISFPDDANDDIFQKLYDQNTHEAGHENLKALSKQIKKENKPISFFGDILLKIIQSKSINTRIVKEIFTLKTNGVDELTHTMNDGPSVTNVTNLFRKACFWLSNLNYKIEGKSLKKGLLTRAEFQLAKQDDTVSSLLVKTRTDSTQNQEGEDVKDNSKQEIKELMDSCLHKLMEYLDLSCGLHSKVKNKADRNNMKKFTVSHGNDSMKLLYADDEIDRIFEQKILDGEKINAEFIYKVLGMILYHKTNADGNQVHMAKALGRLYGQNKTNNGMLVNTALISFDRLAALIANWYSTFLFFQRGKSAVIGFVGNRSVCNEFWIQKVQTWCKKHIMDSVSIDEPWIANAKYLNPLAVCSNNVKGKDSLESITDWFESKVNNKLLSDKTNVRGKSVLGLYKLASDILKILETIKAKGLADERDKGKLEDEINKIDKGTKVNIQSLFNVETPQELFNLTQKISITPGSMVADLERRVDVTLENWNDSQKSSLKSSGLFRQDSLQPSAVSFPDRDQSAVGMNDFMSTKFPNSLDASSDWDAPSSEESDEEEEEEGEEEELSDDGGKSTPKKRKRKYGEVDKTPPGSAPARTALIKRGRSQIDVADISERALQVTPRDIESEVSLIINRNRIKSLIYFYYELFENLKNEGDNGNPWSDYNKDLYKKLQEFNNFLKNFDAENSLDYILFMWRNPISQENEQQATDCANQVIKLFQFLKVLSSKNLVITSDAAKETIAKKLGIIINNSSNEVTMSVYCEYQKTKIIELMKSLYKFPEIYKKYINNPITVHVLDEIQKIILLNRFYKQTSKEAQSMRGLTLEDIETRRRIEFMTALTDIHYDFNQKDYSDEEKELIRKALKRFQENIGIVIDDLFSSSGKRNARRGRDRKEKDIIDALLLSIKPHSLKREAIKPDGNCFFASILEGTKKLERGTIFTQNGDSDTTEISKIRKVLNKWINDKISTLRNQKKIIERKRDPEMNAEVVIKAGQKVLKLGENDYVTDPDIQNESGTIVRIKPPTPIQLNVAKSRAKKMMEELFSGGVEKNEENMMWAEQQKVEYINEWKKDQEVLTQFDKMNIIINDWYEEIPEEIKNIYITKKYEKADAEDDEDYEFRIKLLVYSDFLTIDTSLKSEDPNSKDTFINNLQKEAKLDSVKVSKLSTKFWGGQLETYAAQSILKHEYNINLESLSLKNDREGVVALIVNDLINSSRENPNIVGIDNDMEIDHGSAPQIATEKITILYSGGNHYDLLVPDISDSSDSSSDSDSIPSVEGEGMNKLPEKDETISSLEQQIKERQAELKKLQDQLVALKQKKGNNVPAPMDVD